jgi:hypothetical protein
MTTTATHPPNAPTARSTTSGRTLRQLLAAVLGDTRLDVRRRGRLPEVFPAPATNSSAAA